MIYAVFCLCLGGSEDGQVQTSWLLHYCTSDAMRLRLSSGMDGVNGMWLCIPQTVLEAPDTETIDTLYLALWALMI